MAGQRSELPHDFPDRVMRDAVVNPDNPRALLREVAPDIAPRLDYSRLEIVQRPYFLDDWRRRDSDVLVRIPFLDGSRELLVCVLIEHQSTADPVMPLRVLVYAVLFWEQEWKQWEDGHERGTPLRLTPVLPVVFHTGAQPWDTSRALSDLFDVPAELQAWLPRWTMPLWDLQQHPVQELLQSPEAFWQALAVVRAEREPPDDFLTTLRQALERIQTRGTEAPIHWDQLVRLVLSWSFYRRSHREHDRVLELARESHSDVALQRRIEQMSQQLEKTWEEEMLEQIKDAEKRGELRGRTAEQLEARRATLRDFLEARFQTLSAELLQRIEAADLEHLRAALRQVLTIQSPAELQL